MAWWAAHPEVQDGYAVVATTGADDQIIAHGCYERDRHGDDHAEVALAIADAHQGRGLGTLILGRLAAVADQRDIDVFTAHVLPQNHRMLRVFFATAASRSPDELSRVTSRSRSRPR